MESIALTGVFRLWGYGVGHSQLLLHAQGADSDSDSTTVLFEGVRALKLRQSYPNLTLQQADEPARTRLLDYANLPQTFRRDELCLILPTEDDGFVVCGRVTVVAARRTDEESSGWRWPDDGRVLWKLARQASRNA